MNMNLFEGFPLPDLSNKFNV